MSATFSAFSKGQNFEKNLKQKRCKLLLFKKKNKVEMVKNVRSCSKSLIMWKLRICSG